MVSVSPTQNRPRLSERASSLSNADNVVRRDLRQGSASDTRVGDVAAKWGFWHLGRFAGDYKAMFGELPSETVRAVS